MSNQLNKSLRGFDTTISKYIRHSKSVSARHYDIGVIEDSARKGAALSLLEWEIGPTLKVRDAHTQVPGQVHRISYRTS